MTIVESNGFTGVPIVDVRPYARVRMGQQLLTVAKDQAYAYKALTGNAVPNAPGVSVATNHIHDGVNGAIIPIPACQQWLGLTMPPGLAPGDYVPVIYLPIYCPPGFTRYRISLWTTNTFLQQRLKISVQNESLQTTGGSSQIQVAQETVGGLNEVYADVTTTAGSVNIIRVESWDGDEIPFDRDIVCFSIVPYVGQPSPAMSVRNPAFNDAGVLRPSPTTHLGSNAFTSFDDAMFDDDRGISSYITGRLNLNEAYVFERLTGQPAGSNAATAYDGHAHGGGTSPSTASDNVGALMDHALGAWFYGCARGPTSSYLSADMSAAANTTWRGRINAPVHTSGNAWETIAEHVVRLPKATTAAYADGTGKLNIAALVYLDTTKGNSSVGVRATMLNDAGASAGSDLTLSSSIGSTGWELLQDSGLDISGAGSGEEAQILRIEMALDSTPSGPSACVYGVCLWMEP